MVSFSKRNKIAVQISTPDSLAALIYSPLADLYLWCSDLIALGVEVNSLDLVPMVRWGPDHWIISPQHGGRTTRDGGNPLRSQQMPVLAEQLKLESSVDVRISSEKFSWKTVFGGVNMSNHARFIQYSFREGYDSSTASSIFQNVWSLWRVPPEKKKKILSRHVIWHH